MGHAITAPGSVYIPTFTGRGKLKAMLIVLWYVVNTDFLQ